MSQTMLFIAGAVVTAISFTGIFLYLMLTFASFSEREDLGSGKVKSQQ